MAFLVIEKNELNEENRSATLGNETIIGREKTNAVFIDDSRASRQHAKIIREPDGSYYIIDLGSRNGTIVNNETVSRYKLMPKDRILIGKTVLVFNEESPPPTRPEPTGREGELAQGRPEVLSSEASEKKGLASEMQKLVRDIDTAKDKESVKTKEIVKPINNKTSIKEVSGWVKVLVFITFLLFFIAVLFWAKWAGEKLIAHLTESRQAENIPSSPPPK